MDNRTIFTKTAKGLGESIGKTKALSRDARKVIIEINGVAAFNDLLAKLDHFSEEKLTAILAKLKADDYVREFNPPPITGDDESRLPVEAKLDDALTALTMGAFLRELEPSTQETQGPDSSKDDPLFARTEIDTRQDAGSVVPNEAKAKGKKSADAASRQKSEARAKKDAADKAKNVADAKAKEDAALIARQKIETQLSKDAEQQKRREAEEKKDAVELAHREEEARIEKDRQKEADDRAWHKFEAKAKQEAEALALQKAKAKAEQEFEEKQQREAEEDTRERARLVAEEKARQVAQEKEKKERQEAEELARKLAKAQKEKEAEDKAWQKFEAKAKKEAEEKAQRETEKLIEVLARQAMEEQARKEIAETEKAAAEELARQEAQLKEKKEAEDALQRELEKIAEEFARIARDEQVRKELAEEQKKVDEALAIREMQQREEKDARELAQREAEKIAEALKRQKTEARLKKEAEDKARRELEAKNKKEAAESARQKIQEEKERAEIARRQAEEKEKQDADALAREQAEQQREADEKARREAQEQSMKEAAEAQVELDAEHALQIGLTLAANAAEEQRARDEVERQARLLAEAQAKQEQDMEQQKAAKDIADKVEEEIARGKISEAANAAELAAQKAQEQARVNAIAREKEQARQEAAALSRERIEERNRKKIEQKRQREAERKLRRHVADMAPVNGGNLYGASRSWGMSLLGICFLVIVALLAWSQLTSFDEKIAQFEKAGSEQLQQKVKIDQLHFSFLPQPHWQLEGVAIGEQGQIKVPQVNAILDLGALSEDTPTFKSIEFQSPVLNEEGLSWLLFGRSQKQSIRINHISASSAKFSTPHINLGDFEVEAEIGAGNSWKKMTLQSTNKEMNIELQPKGEQVQIKLNAKTLAVPFGSSLKFSTFSAEGILERSAVSLSQFYGVIYDGTLTGNARLSWDKNWLLKGDVKAKQIDVAKWLPELFQNGELEGSGKFTMQAREIGKLFASQRMNGNFLARNGTIQGVDLVKQLQGGDNTGTSSFNDLAGWFSYDTGRIKLGNVKLTAGLVSAIGNADVDSNQEINGHFSVDLETPVRKAHVDLVVSGHLGKPHFDSTSTGSR
ncbi:MAG: hypothetical protein Q7J77_03005 [Undibacterium sp.]|nr:hypothetical protein [Undibacterium sp.]